jgi:hypothetical protein
VPFDASNAHASVDAYRRVYGTIDVHGRPTTASELVVLPRNAQRDLQTLVYEHGTTVTRRFAPSTDAGSDARLAALLFASAGVRRRRAGLPRPRYRPRCPSLPAPPMPSSLRSSRVRPIPTSTNYNLTTLALSWQRIYGLSRHDVFAPGTTRTVGLFDGRHSDEQIFAALPQRLDRMFTRR